MKKRLITVLATAAILFGTACTPQEIAIFNSLTPDQQAAVKQSMEPKPVSVASTPYGVWDRLAQCESHGQWNYGPHSNWGSRIYHGGLQFHPTTWSAYKLSGYPTYAYQASREQQIEVGKRVQAAQGWRAWPDCSLKLGLR